MNKKNKINKVMCGACKTLTNHEIVAEKITHGSSDNDDIQWWGKYQIIECKGCDDISFRLLTGSSEDFDPNTGEEIENEYLYPDRKTGRSMIEEKQMLPYKTRKIYNETIQALNANLLILSAIGLRGLIESICLEQKVAGKNLEVKIKALATKGLLSEKQADVLHTHRFLGNEAAHQIEAPKPYEIIAALEIAEILLKTIYVIPELNDSIKTKK